MSDTDSFIEEVSEEVRRDQLFKLMKRYGWIAIVLVLVLVGGAGVNEWQKAQKEKAAQAMGDSLLTALRIEDPAERRDALNAIDGQGGVGAVANLLKSTEDSADGVTPEALAALEAIASDETVPAMYSQLAELKLVILNAKDIDPKDRIARLTPLTTPGAPYRLLAEEQIAIAEVAMGDTDAAINRLQLLLQDGEVSSGLRQRAGQLIVALGGTLETA
ncbi:MAG: tetratricopeptide repeat protein [Marinosulfonomonas sp.]